MPFPIKWKIPRMEVDVPALIVPLRSALRLLARWVPVSDALPDSRDSSHATRILFNNFDSLEELRAPVLGIGSLRSPDELSAHFDWALHKQKG
jgi:hypothetical protein